MFKPVVVIPVYNHPNTIAEVVRAIRNAQYDCLLVNDGSNEQCSQLLRELSQQDERVILAEHLTNQGKGAAVCTGLKQAHALGYTHALQVDADGQHNLSDIQRFFEIAQSKPDALVCGYPIYDETVPKVRLYARYLTHIWVWINTLSLRIKDSMCGFRVYPLKSIVSLINKQSFTTMRMGWDTEILVRSDWLMIPIVNISTRVHYPENGVSHFNAFKDNVYISRMHATLFLGMIWRSPQLLIRYFRRRT